MARQSVPAFQYRTARRETQPATMVPAALNNVRATGSGSLASRLKSSAANGGYVNGNWGPPAQSMLPRYRSDGAAPASLRILPPCQ